METTVPKQQYSNQIEIAIQPNQKQRVENKQIDRKQTESKSRPKVIGKQTKICALFQTIQSSAEKTQVIPKVHHSFNASSPKSHFQQQKIQQPQHKTQLEAQPIFQQKVQKHLSQQKQERQECQALESPQNQVSKRQVVMDSRDCVQLEKCEDNKNPQQTAPTTETTKTKQKSRPKVIGCQTKVHAQIHSVPLEETSENQVPVKINPIEKDQPISHQNMEVSGLIDEAKVCDSQQKEINIQKSSFDKNQNRKMYGAKTAIDAYIFDFGTGESKAETVNDSLNAKVQHPQNQQDSVVLEGIKTNDDKEDQKQSQNIQIQKQPQSQQKLVSKKQTPLQQQTQILQKQQPTEHEQKQQTISLENVLDQTSSIHKQPKSQQQKQQRQQTVESALEKQEEIVEEKKENMEAKENQQKFQVKVIQKEKNENEIQKISSKQNFSIEDEKVAQIPQNESNEYNESEPIMQEQKCLSKKSLSILQLPNVFVVENAENGQMIENEVSGEEEATKNENLNLEQQITINQQNKYENHKDSHHKNEAKEQQNNNTNNNIDSKVQNQSQQHFHKQIEKENQGEQDHPLLNDTSNNQEVQANMKDPPNQSKLQIPPTTSNTSLLTGTIPQSKHDEKDKQQNIESSNQPSSDQKIKNLNTKIQSSLFESHPDQSSHALNLVEKQKQNNQHCQKGKVSNDSFNGNQNLQSVLQQKQVQQVKMHLCTDEQLKPIEKMEEQKDKVDFQKQNLENKQIREPNHSINLFQTQKQNLPIAAGEDKTEQNQLQIDQKECLNVLSDKQQDQKAGILQNSVLLMQQSKMSSQSKVPRKKISSYSESKPSKAKLFEKTQKEMVQRESKTSEKAKDEEILKRKIQKGTAEQKEKSAQHKILINKHKQQSQGFLPTGFCVDLAPTDGKSTILNQTKKLNDKKSLTQVNKQKLQQLKLPKRGPLSQTKGSFKSLSKKQSSQPCDLDKLGGQKNQNKMGSSKSIEVKRQESHEAIKYPEIGKNKSLNMSKTVEIKKIGYSQFKQSRNKKVLQSQIEPSFEEGLKQNRVNHDKLKELSKSVLVQQQNDYQSPKSPFRVMEKSSIKKINFSSPYLEPVFRKSILHNSRKAIGKGKAKNNCLEDRGDYSDDETCKNEKKQKMGQKQANSMFHQKQAQNQLQKLRRVEESYGQQKRRAKTSSKKKHRNLGLYQDERNEKIETDSEQQLMKKGHKYLKAHSHQFSFLYPSTVLHESGEKLNKRLGELDKKLKKDHNEKKEDVNQHQYLAFYKKIQK